MNSQLFCKDIILGAGGCVPPYPQSLKHMLGAGDWLNYGSPICKPVNVPPDVMDVIQVGTFPRAASGSWAIQGANGIAKVFMRRRPAGPRAKISHS